MTFNKKIKTIDNEIEQNKAQCNLERQTSKILVLSSTNVGQYKFLKEKAVTIKIFE